MRELSEVPKRKVRKLTDVRELKGMKKVDKCEK